MLTTNTNPTFSRVNNLGYTKFAIECLLNPGLFYRTVQTETLSDTEVNELPSPGNQTSRLDSSTQETSVADSQVELSPSNEVLNGSVLLNTNSQTVSNTPNTASPQASAALNSRNVQSVINGDIRRYFKTYHIIWGTSKSHDTAILETVVDYMTNNQVQISL